MIYHIFHIQLPLIMLGIKTLGNITALYRNEQMKRKQMIQMAIENSYNMLTIQTFIDATGFQLVGTLPFNTMWNSFRRNIPIYITDDLIKAFGYSGTLYKQKQSIFKLVEKYKIQTIRLSNEEYAEFSHTPQDAPNNENQVSHTLQGRPNDSQIDFKELYPSITKAQLKSKPTHVLIMPRDLKKLLLVVNTENGNLVREYMIALDELFELYMCYQDEYKSRQLAIKDTKIDELISEMKQQTTLLTEIRTEQDEQTEMIDELTDKVDRATDERAPRANSYGSFILLQLNDPESYFHFYAIRAEQKRALRARDRIIGKHADATTAIKIDYQPNAMNLFTLIKENLGKKGNKLVEENGNYMALSLNYTANMFIADVRRIEASKKSV